MINLCQIRATLFVKSVFLMYIYIPVSLERYSKLLSIILPEQYTTLNNKIVLRYAQRNVR